MKFSKYKNLAEKAIVVLVEMSMTYLHEEGISSLAEIMSKKKKLNT